MNKHTNEELEQIILELREALEHVALSDDNPAHEWDREKIDTALSASAPIASRWVPVEDVRPLLYKSTARPDWGNPESDLDAARKDFLAKHGDKLAPTSQ